MTSWTQAQISRSLELEAAGATLAFYCSDQHGRPVNGGSQNPKWTCFPGAVHQIDGPLALCTDHALHATFQPHRWLGSRVWVVAMIGDMQREDKIGALHREVIGEILPEDCIDPSIGVRIGIRNLSGSVLRGSDLSGSVLRGSDLSGAYRPIDPPCGWRIAANDTLERVQ